LLDGAAFPVFIDWIGSDGGKTVVVVERYNITNVAVPVSMYVDDAGGCFLKTSFASAAFASHLTIYNHWL
jgi:hypothetical protein